ncbi:MAG: hypothetical protein ABSF63_10210 [Candidatus Bathyarchaeia archaeon]|jgi:hypothetical protein
MVHGLDRNKLLKVRGFTLEPFNKRLERDDHWAIVRTKPADGWIEVIAGIKEKEHFHWGINMDMTHRFLKRRGVLKSYEDTARAEWAAAANPLTDQILDEEEQSWGKGEYSLIIDPHSNSRTKTVRIDARLVKSSEISD